MEKVYSALLLGLLFGLILSIPIANALIERAIERGGDKVNGWSFDLSYGKYKNILTRAVVAKGLLGANAAEEAVYYSTYFDSDSRRLNSKYRYVIHFAPDNKPPVNGFWSLTIVKKSDLALVPNTINRYSISDRTPGLTYNSDGSLDIYIQHDMPTDDKKSNWLPAPDDDFQLILRCYEPGPAILKGTWLVPAVTRII
jgi:hypothetical protein